MFIMLEEVYHAGAAFELLAKNFRIPSPCRFNQLQLP
jgi:hypothetical protein